MALLNWIPRDTQQGKYLRTGFRPAGVYHNPTVHIIPFLSSILQDRDLYKPGGVYYGSDTHWAECEMIPKAPVPNHDEYPLGGMAAGLS